MKKRKISINRDPYNKGFSICRLDQITIKSGLTVLVGCNGAGKTTLLRNILQELQKKKIPCVMYDNLRDGGNNSRSKAGHEGDRKFVFTSLQISEGENISLNIGSLASKLAEFRDFGRIPDSFNKNDKAVKTNERWLLFDGIDSGYSIDNIVELKEFFNLIIEDFSKVGRELYIVVSANEYELANGEECFDVINGEYIRFSDYDDFKKFIFKSKQQKELNRNAVNPVSQEEG